VKLSGRAQAHPARRERKVAKRARGAPPRACHGPLQRWLAVKEAASHQLCAPRLSTSTIGTTTSPLYFPRCPCYWEVALEIEWGADKVFTELQLISGRSGLRLTEFP